MKEHREKLEEMPDGAEAIVIDPEWESDSGGRAAYKRGEFRTRCAYPHT